MTTFAILQEQNGRRHWVRAADTGCKGGFATALQPPPKELQYRDRETAEKDAGVYRMINANDVESAERRKLELPPATFTVVPLEPEEVTP